MTLKEYLDSQLFGLVPDPDDYVGVNNNPKIIFVNGHWNKMFSTPLYNFGPTAGGPSYWAGDLVSNSPYYFGVNFADIKYVDGSSLVGLDQSGGDRVRLGAEWAQRNYSYLTSNSNNNLDICLVGHSEGGGYAVGIANYLNSRGHRIKEILLLSCDEADEFTVNYDFPTFQLVLSYWKRIVRWGSVRWEIRVDWMVGNHRLTGTRKYGVVVGNYDYDTVHGRSKRADSVLWLAPDLKEVSVYSFFNQLGQIYYTQSDTTYSTKFYSINNDMIAPNHPLWDDITKTIKKTL